MPLYHERIKAITTTTFVATVQDVLAIARLVSDADRRRLVELLPLDEDAPLPVLATIDQAIELYLAGACSLSRAAELAKVTRWDLIDCLKELDIPILMPEGRSAKEMDELAEELEREGIL